MKKIKRPSRRRTIWIADKTWIDVQTAARADERTVSDWVRRAIKAALKGGG